MAAVYQVGVPAAEPPASPGSTIPVTAPAHTGTVSTTTIAVIGPCARPGCDRPARVHVEVEIQGRVVRGPVCDRCERATRLGVLLLAGEVRRPA
jgi:hypothetical protein